MKKQSFSEAVARALCSVIRNAEDLRVCSQTASARGCPEHDLSRLLFRCLGGRQGERLVCLLLGPRPEWGWGRGRLPRAAGGEGALEISLKCKLGNLQMFPLLSLASVALRILLGERGGEEGALGSMGLKWHLESSCAVNPKDPQNLWGPWWNGGGTGVLLSL